MAATAISDVTNGHPVIARGGKAYFAHNGNLIRVNADGTGQTTLTSFGPYPNLTSLTTDDTNLYYAVGNGSGSPTTICKIAR